MQRQTLGILNLRAMSRIGAVCLCLASLLLATTTVPARANERNDQAVEVIRGLAADIWVGGDRQLDERERERYLAKVIAASTNVDLLSRLALGRHWRSLDADDRTEYQTLFSDVVIGGLAVRLGSVLRDIDGPLDDHFAITGSADAGKHDILVRSRVTPGTGQPLSVDWRLRELDDGPAIIDLIIEGVSLLVSQRAEFAAVIERNQINGLIDALRIRARNDRS